MGPVATDLHQTLTSASKFFNVAEESMKSLESALDKRAPIRRELLMTLEHVSEAARSISILADYLQRHPESILSGKKDSKE